MTGPDETPQDAAPVEAEEPNVDDALPVDASPEAEASDNTPVEENSQPLNDEGHPLESADTPDE